MTVDAGRQSRQAALIARLDQLDRAALTPIMRRVLRNRHAELVAWRWSPISYAAYYPRRVLVRVEGQANVRGTAAPWAAIVKIIEPPAAPGEAASAGRPLAAAVWDREVRAYRSELLGRLPAGLVAPRLLLVGCDPAEAGGALWLWLEQVEDALGGRWPLAHYGIAARHFGRFNGFYSLAPAFPPYRWLNQQWAASHSEPHHLPETRREVEELLSRPGVRATLPAAVGDRIRRLLDDQPAFVDVLARLPHTLCHHDASSANLFARRRAAPNRVADECDAWETVAIDWEDIGTGPVGAEMATLVFGTMRRQAVPVQRASTLAHTVLQHYEQGLRDAGWRGDPQLVRLGYAAAVALRWFAVPAALRLVADQPMRQAVDGQAQGATQLVPEPQAWQRLALMYFLLDCADEARSLCSA